MSVILIPTLNPDEKLIDYVVDLKINGFKNVLIINDGSEDYANAIFETISNLQDDNFEVTVFKHAANLGKGRALKNGINYYLNNLKGKYKGSQGLITVDSDGQHRVEDVIRIDKQISNSNQSSMILGCRDFDNPNVPFKSKFGNKLTKFIFKLFFGRNVSDTQTGLRGMSNEILKYFIGLDGERFEYETNVLIECVNRNISIDEIMIETVYENDNQGTHFNPVTDSIKIYRLLLARFLRYIVASCSSSLIDLLLFASLCRWIPSSNSARIYIATIVARVISSIYNYEINKSVVFKSKQKGIRTAIQYFSLCIVVMLISGFCVDQLYDIVGNYEFVIKCFVDTILFFCNYLIQQNLIFKNKRKE